MRRPRPRDGDSADEAAEVPQVGQSVALSATMQRCLALLRRTRHAVLEEARCRWQVGGDGEVVGECPGSNWAVELAEYWGALADEIDCGRISNAGQFGRRVRALVEDVPVGWPPRSPIDLPFATIVRRLEDELLVVEMPEIKCGRFELGLVRGPALVLEVEFIVELSQASGPWCAATLSPRWAWAEISVSSVTGSLDVLPALRIDGALGDNALSKSTGKSTGATTYKRRLTSNACEDAAAARMLSMLEGSQCIVHVSLRVDWPVLLSSRLRLRGCALTFGSFVTSAECDSRVVR